MWHTNKRPSRAYSKPRVPASGNEPPPLGQCSVQVPNNTCFSGLKLSARAGTHLRTLARLRRVGRGACAGAGLFVTDSTHACELCETTSAATPAYVCVCICICTRSRHRRTSQARGPGPRTSLTLLCLLSSDNRLPSAASSRFPSPAFFLWLRQTTNDKRQTTNNKRTTHSSEQHDSSRVNTAILRYHPPYRSDTIACLPAGCLPTDLPLCQALTRIAFSAIEANDSTGPPPLDGNTLRNACLFEQPSRASGRLSTRNIQRWCHRPHPSTPSACVPHAHAGCVIPVARPDPPFSFRSRIVGQDFGLQLPQRRPVLPTTDSQGRLACAAFAGATVLQCLPVSSSFVTLVTGRYLQHARTGGKAPIPTLHPAACLRRAKHSRLPDADCGQSPDVRHSSRPRLLPIVRGLDRHDASPSRPSPALLPPAV